MKSSGIPSFIHFIFVIAVPLCAALMLASILFGCKQKAPEAKTFKATVTVENLQVAYAKEVKYRNMYDRFVREAEKEHFKNMANLFRAIERSEEIHASNHARLLRSQGVEPKEPAPDSITVGTTVQTIKMALSSEDIEFGSMYPNLAKTANIEKYEEAGRQFKQTEDADSRHADLLKEALGRNGKIPQVAYYICPCCGYILTSTETVECPVCHEKQDKFLKV